MTTEVDTLPEITRSDVDLAVVNHWETTTAAEQRVGVDELLDAAARTPPLGLLTVSSFASTGSASDVGLLRGAHGNNDPRRAETREVMTYEQWASEEAYRGHLNTQQQIANRAPASAAARQQPLPAEYRLYRTHRNAAPADTTPSSRTVVIVTIDFDAPNPQRLRRWIDGVIDALKAEPNAVPGMICGHFHASLAGNRVLNYAEWTSEQAYDEALANGPAGVSQTDLPEWRSVRDFPGVTANTVTRYTLDRAIQVLPPAAEDS